MEYSKEQSARRPEIKNYGKENPYQGKEDALCKVIARYLAYNGYCFIHVANERKTNIVRGKHLKDMGVSAGFPDYLIFNGNIAFEVKVKKGRVRANQIEWLHKLQLLDYKVGVVWSLDGLVEFLKETR